MRSRHKPSRRPADCSFCPCTARILNEVDTYFGYWCGAEDYITHFIKGAYDLNDDVAATATVTSEGATVVDMSSSSTGTAPAFTPAKLRPAIEFNNTYSTPIFTARAVKIIEQFTPESENSLFLYLPYQNVHWPLEAPQNYVDMFANSTGGDHKRNMVCAMAKIMDDGIG